METRRRWKQRMCKQGVWKRPSERLHVHFMHKTRMAAFQRALVTACCAVEKAIGKTSCPFHAQNE